MDLSKEGPQIYSCYQSWTTFGSGRIQHGRLAAVLVSITLQWLSTRAANEHLSDCSSTFLLFFYFPRKCSPLYVLYTKIYVTIAQFTNSPVHVEKERSKVKVKLIVSIAATGWVIYDGKRTSLRVIA